MLFEGKERCEWCQKHGFSSCQLHVGAEAMLRQWAKSVLAGGTKLSHPSSTRDLRDRKNRHCLPYDTPEGDEGRQSGQVATRPTIQDLEPPTKQAKKLHVEAAASPSTATVIQPGPAVNQATMFIFFQFFWPSSPTDCSLRSSTLHQA